MAMRHSMKSNVARFACIGVLFLTTACGGGLQGTIKRHAFAWQCRTSGVCIEVQVQQFEKPKEQVTTLLWYRVEDRTTFQILAGTFLPIRIANSAFKASANGKSAVLDHANALVTWHVTDDAARITSRYDEHGEYARATAEGVVAGYEISAKNRSNEAGNPLDGAQLDKIQVRQK